MKKKINGRIYDTDTAKQVAYRCSDLPADDSDYIRECLYRKRNGEYFLAGEGGARTRYAAMLDDGWAHGGKGIVPLSSADAKVWMYYHG